MSLSGEKYCHFFSAMSCKYRNIARTDTLVLLINFNWGSSHYCRWHSWCYFSYFSKSWDLFVFFLRFRPTPAFISWLSAMDRGCYDDRLVVKPLQHGNFVITTDVLLQCFDTIRWVITPVKTIGRITYIVLMQTLNPAYQSINHHWQIVCRSMHTQHIRRQELRCRRATCLEHSSGPLAWRGHYIRRELKTFCFNVASGAQWDFC